MTEKLQRLTDFLGNSLTAYHAKENARGELLKNGFTPLLETEDFELFEGGKYFVERGASLIAFTVGGLDRFSYKIIASHVDSPALKLKENPVKKAENCAALFPMVCFARVRNLCLPRTTIRVQAFTEFLF